MLTTRCPHCSTVFRIRPEQLSVRGGRVRCGHCQQPFSALSHLEEMEDDEFSAASKPAPEQAPAPVSAPASASVQPAAVPSASPATPPAVAPANRQTAAPAVSRSAEAEKARLLAALANAPVPMSSAEALRPWPVPQIPALADSAPAFDGRSERQTLILPEPGHHQPMPAHEAEAPAVGDDFSMNVQLDEAAFKEVKAELADGLDIDFTGLDEEAAPAPAEAAPESEPQPYVSEIARELGVAAYDPSQDQVFGQTVMLSEPIDMPDGPALPAFDNGPQSLFDELERQKGQPAVQVEDRRKRSPGLWIAGFLVLLLLAALQLSYVFRTELTRWLPESRPWLEEACALLGCDVPYPQIMSGDLIVIESSAFTPEAQAGQFRLTATILNKAEFAQAWPHLELTITDRFDIAVARRVLKPAEWLPPLLAQQPAFEAHSEVSANLTLELDQLAASGYRLYVFYP